MGLAPITADVQGTMSAHARGLVWVEASNYLATPEIYPDHLVFQVLPAGPFSPETLAQALKGPGIAGATVQDGRITARLEPGAQAPPPLYTCLDLGPYRQASFAPDRIVLSRRSGRGMDTIEIHDVGSAEEEWRRFLAREVDVVPEVTQSLIKNLSDVPSVRMVPIEHSPYTGLVFRVDRPPFSDLRLRQIVSLGLRRRAVARVIAGSEASAALVPEDPTEASRLLAQIGDAPPIRISFAAPLSEDHRTAMVLEQQLLELGLRVELEPVSIDAATEMLQGGKFEIFIMNAGYTPGSYWRVQTGSIANVTGYSSPELDQAIQAGDHRRAVEILTHDLPMTPLFIQHSAVAIDRKFCGVHPQSSVDLAWLADVHLCAQGETE